MERGIIVSLLILSALLGASLLLSLIIHIFIDPFRRTLKPLLPHITEKFNLDENSRFLDLGAGDGRVVKYVAQNYKSQSYGVEISPIPLIKYKLSSFFTKSSTRKRIQMITRLPDNFEKRFDCIYIYQSPKLISKLKLTELRKLLKDTGSIFTFKSPLSSDNSPIEHLMPNDDILYEYKVSKDEV